jgi:hypothetical protein
MEAIQQAAEHNPMSNFILCLLLFVALLPGHFGRFDLSDA